MKQVGLTGDCEDSVIFRRLLQRLTATVHKTSVENALALHRRGEARDDGLVLIKASHHLEIEWEARGIHPWDQGRSEHEKQTLFCKQCYEDTEAAVSRLFAELPDVDAIQFRVVRPNSDNEVLTGTVTRSTVNQITSDLTPRTKLWRMGTRL